MFAHRLRFLGGSSISGMTKIMIQDEKYLRNQSVCVYFVTAVRSKRTFRFLKCFQATRRNFFLHIIPAFFISILCGRYGIRSIVQCIEVVWHIFIRVNPFYEVQNVVEFLLFFFNLETNFKFTFYNFSYPFFVFLRGIEEWNCSKYIVDVTTAFHIGTTNLFFFQRGSFAWGTSIIRKIVLGNE